MSASPLFDSYGPVAGFDEMFGPDAVRSSYVKVHEAFDTMDEAEVRVRAESLASSYLDQGVTFGVAGEERPFPLDIVPRLIEAADWNQVEQGVRQRVLALEKFLEDVYGLGELFDDGVVPREVIVTSPHYHRIVANMQPPNGVRIHVSGIDLIRDGNGDFR
ncbi:MAG: circularly permuted type 2 ATP-grasp protein, partial [Aeromicrobium sp.]